MENKIELAATRPTLLMLYENCHIEIFDFLKLKDSVNLAATCRHLRYVGDRIFKKYSKFRLDERIIRRGEKHINYVFSFVGKHVTSLEINFLLASLQLSELLEIINTCENLTCLQIYEANIEESESDASFYSFDKVEMLTLIDCENHFPERLLVHFSKLRLLHIQSLIKSNDLKPALQKNPNIESFVYWTHGFCGHFNYQSLELIPNVERLGLMNYFENISELNSILKLNRLTKLKLYCLGKNINDFLRELAKKGILEEMELDNVETNDNFFDILKSYDKLRLLGINADEIRTLKRSLVWPTKLKRLLLSICELTDKDLIEMIGQLQSLESIDLIIYPSYYQTHFADVTKLSQRILDVIGRSNRKQRLDMVLSEAYVHYEKDESKKYRFDSEYLRILHSEKWDTLGIAIHFPGAQFYY